MSKKENGLVTWIKRVFIEQYELTVWFTEPDGSKRKEVYELKRIDKKSANHIIGVDPHNMHFEICTVAPFDYQIKKVL